MNAYTITKDSFYSFLKALEKDFQVYALKEKNFLYPKGEPYFKERGFTFFPLSEIDSPEIIYGQYRGNLSIKSFFTPLKEKLVGKTINSALPFVIVGAKNCDLKSIEVQDFVFANGDFKDPFYLKARQDNLIISCDCTEAKSVCYCLHLGINPYPEEGFDLNLTDIGEELIVRVGSEKGERLIKENQAAFSQAGRAHIEKMQDIHKKTEREIIRNLTNLKMPPIDKWPALIRDRLESKLWEETALSCVECGGCTQICPTCHCFILGDQKSAFGYERFKIWDSCQYNGFARVAGGANPRPRRFQRLRNRYVKKFDYFPQVAHLIACTGCGRCIEACPGKIDMRKIFRSLGEENSVAST